MQEVIVPHPTKPLLDVVVVSLLEQYIELLGKVLSGLIYAGVLMITSCIALT